MGMDKLPNENMQKFIEFPKGSGISKTTLKTFLKSAISKKIKGVISLSLKINSTKNFRSQVYMNHLADTSSIKHVRDSSSVRFILKKVT